MSAPALSEPVIIARFFKGHARKDIVRVTLSEYEGVPIVDVRQFFTGEDGKVRPTKKGVALAVRRLPDLASAIGKAVAKARELGLIEDDAS